MSASDAYTQATVLGLQEAQPALLDAVIENVRATYPSYATVSDAALDESFRQNIQMCLIALQDSRVPSRQVLTRWADIARRRFETDVPVDDLIRSYRFSIGLIADEVTELVAAQRLPAHHGLAAYRLLWEVSDTYIAILVEVYRLRQLQLDTDNQQAKVALLDRLRNGRFDSSGAFLARSRFGLNDDQPYMPFIARRVDGREDVYSLALSLDPHLAGSRGLAVIEVDRVSGICAEEFRSTDAIAVAYGPPRPLADLASSFDTAEQIMETSLVSRPGNVHLGDATWRTAVRTSGTGRHLREYFERQFVEPLTVAGVDVGVMLDSLKVHVERNRSFAASAAELHCHPNTLRYRMSRFEELTGHGIESSETIVALQWFFELRSRTTPHL